MKKIIIAALVGGIILFLWQFLSWNVTSLHEPAQRYTPQQEKIMSALNSMQLEEGGYIIPMPPPGATTEEWQKLMESAAGKPWAKVEYHKAMDDNMVLNAIRGVVINIITVWLLCWILSRLRNINFGTILTASVFTGLIVFFSAPYTHYIWYQDFDIWGHFADAIIGWGLVGLWLAWWISRQHRNSNVSSNH